MLLRGADVVFPLPLFRADVPVIAGRPLQWSAGPARLKVACEKPPTKDLVVVVSIENALRVAILTLLKRLRSQNAIGDIANNK